MRAACIGAAALTLSLPATALAQSRCDSADNLARIDDAQGRLFARPSEVDYEGAERGLRFALRDCPSDPVVNALIGLAQLGMQRYVLAEQHLQLALAFHREDAWWRQNSPVLLERLAQLRRALGSVMVTVNVPEAVLHLADERAVVLPLREPIRVPAGRSTLRVSAPGHVEVTREVTVAADAVERVSVELTPAPQTRPEVVLRRDVVRELRHTSPWRTAGWVTLGVGVASVIAGAVSWARTSDQNERALTATAGSPDGYGAWARYSYALDTRDGASLCQGARDGVGDAGDAQTVRTLCDDNREAQVMAWAFTLVGAALMTGGATMALLARDRVEEQRVTPRVSAMLGAVRGVSLTVRFP